MADTKLFKAIHRAVETGKFDDYRLVDVILSKQPGEDHFASEVVFAEVKLENGLSEQNVHVVIKEQRKDESIRRMMNTDIQFYNEVIMYNELLPALDQNEMVRDIFPKCFYANASTSDNYEEDVVVVENLRQKGFRMTNEKLFLDLDHCVLVLKNLAKFHALSYAKKHDNAKEFYRLVKMLRETRYLEESREEMDKFFLTTIFRGVKPLDNENVELKTLIDNIKELFEEPFSMMLTLCQPEEPLAVVCHGDLCRNNMLFRYDDEGKPVEVRFFDVATARYASPAIDLAFFLSMNTSTELRREHWHELLQVYHTSLSTALPQFVVPPLADIKTEVAEKALYGYTLCSFFIPMMMDPDLIKSEQFTTMTPEEIEALTEFRGGEDVTKILTDLFRDLIELNYL